MLVSIVVLLGLAIFIYQFVMETLGANLIWFLIFAPFFIFGKDIVFDLKIYFRHTEYEIEPLAEPQLSRVKNLMQPLLKKCHLLRHSFFYFLADDGDDTGVIMHQGSAYLAIEEDILDRPDHELQSVLAHELTHVVFSDGLRAIFLNTISILLVIYSVMVIPILLLTMSQVPWYIIVLGLAISLRFLTSWTNKISEITADTGATLLGYGPGLQDFFSHTPNEQDFLVWLFDNHESRSKRVSRISRIVKHLK